MYKLIVVLLLLTHTVFAQSEMSNWFTEFEAAKMYATHHEGQILMVFAGSDWCKHCMKFKKEVLTADAFQEFSLKKIAVLYVDFPVKAEHQLSKAQTTHNSELAEKYNPKRYFPLAILMNKDATILGKPQFTRQTTEEYMMLLNKILRKQ